MMQEDKTNIFSRTVSFMSVTMTKDDIPYGEIRTVAELGQLARVHRKSQRLTLKTISGLGNLSMRFLSEFERGKETAEIGKILKTLRTLGLEVIIRPRGSAAPSPRHKIPAAPRPGMKHRDRP